MMVCGLHTSTQKDISDVNLTSKSQVHEAPSDVITSAVSMHPPDSYPSPEAAFSRCLWDSATPSKQWVQNSSFAAAQREAPSMNPQAVALSVIRHSLTKLDVPCGQPGRSQADRPKCTHTCSCVPAH
jgi:hypothetical protein